MENLSEAQTESAQQLAATMNERLDSYSLGNATKALNLSCSIALIPGIIIIIVVFLLSNYNWIIAATTTILIAITVFLLANLASSLARKRSRERLFDEEIKPEIDQNLDELRLTWNQFNAIATDFLPSTAPLLILIPQYTT